LTNIFIAFAGQCESAIGPIVDALVKSRRYTDMERDVAASRMRAGMMIFMVMGLFVTAIGVAALF
jgi:hypothetical protein